MATKRQISNEVFWKKLTEGEYKAIIDYASQRENELDVQIRDNYLNIYYRGGNLLRVHPRSLYFDEFYFHRGAKDMRKSNLIKSDKTEDKELVASYKKKRNEMFSILRNEGMAAYSAKMKEIMNEWEEDLHTIGISHDEKNAQQLISMKNRGNTEYTVIDLEYAVSRTSSFYYDGDAVVPVKVIGPTTPESERESWELIDSKEYYDSYEDYVKDWDDWHWDSVTVHPLAKLKTDLYQMANTEVVTRIHLFPYQKNEIKDENLTSV